MLSFEWRYMTIWRLANVTIFQYMTLWLLFIASILNILSSHYMLLKPFLYAAHYKNNKTPSNSGRKHSRSKSHNRERCHTRGKWGEENSSVHGKCHSRTSEESEAGVGDGSQNTHHLMRWNQWPLWSGSESWKRWVMERILLNKRRRNMQPNEAPHQPPPILPPTGFTVLSAAQKCLSCTFTVGAIWGLIRFLNRSVFMKQGELTYSNGTQSSLLYWP